MDKIRLKNIQIYAYHGLHPEEKNIGQKFQIDIELSADLKKPCRTDSINDTIDYYKVYEIAEQCLKNNRSNLIEYVAQNIANKVLAISGVVDIQVVVRKPSVPIDGICDSIEVEIFRKKND